jgi:hypothetical protein
MSSNSNDFQEVKIYDFQYSNSSTSFNLNLNDSNDKKISFSELIKNSNFCLDSVLKRSLSKVFQDLNGLSVEEFKNFAHNVVGLDEKIILSTYHNNK